LLQRSALAVENEFAADSELWVGIITGAGDGKQGLPGADGPAAAADLCALAERAGRRAVVGSGLEAAWFSTRSPEATRSEQSRGPS